MSYYENFKFTKVTVENGRIISSTEKEFDATFLDDVIMNFQEFLRGCGYYFDGEIGIISEKEEQ